MVKAMTRYPESREVEYLLDDARLVHDERTGSWTLYRIPTPNMLLEAARGRNGFRTMLHDDWTPERVAAYCAPVRVEMPSMNTAPNRELAPEVCDD